MSKTKTRLSAYKKKVYTSKYAIVRYVFIALLWITFIAATIRNGSTSVGWVFVNIYATIRALSTIY